jgi:hypothetical protein
LSSSIRSSKSLGISSRVNTRESSSRITRPEGNSTSSRIISGRSSRSGSSIREGKTSAPTSTGRPERTGRLGTSSNGGTGDRSAREPGSREGGFSRRSRDGRSDRESQRGLRTSRNDISINARSLSRLSPRTRIRKVVPESRTSVIDTVVVHDNKRGDRTGLLSYRLGRFSRGLTHIRYHDRPNIISYNHHNDYSYIDWRHRLCYTPIWPRYRNILYYSFGPWSTFRYFYPYYHRKYIFVSLCGYWPLHYPYMRYYWYGYHPYAWYGYYPIAREIQGNTYNYYTYNYYTGDDGVVSGQVVDGITPVDHNTFADVREKLAQQATEEPAEVTPADIYFEDAVKAFEADNYEMAIEKFGEAMALAPDDMILPFAYSQALFARGQYSEASEVLRQSLAKVTPDKEGVFYPRGLYSDDDVLFEQINTLAERAELYSFDANLQLLLGYQLLGIGRLDEAVVPLQNASLDMENAVAATTLLNVLEKIRAENVTVESDNQ